MGGNVRSTKQVSTLLKDFYKLDGKKISEKESEKKVVDQPVETVYELTQKALAMADALMATRGVQNMASNPIMSNVFSSNPKRNENKETSTTRQQRIAKTPNKDPNYTKVPAKIVRPLKLNDSIADILAKMYNFMLKKYTDDDKAYKKEKKYRKKLVAIKEKRIEELIHLFGGKYTKKILKDKDESFFSKLLRYAVVGGALLIASKAALASIEKKVKDALPEIPDFMSFLNKNGSQSEGMNAQGGKNAGDWKNDTEFLNKVNVYAKEKRIKASDLLSVMAVESGIDPAKRNPNGGATGLIQFTKRTAETLGTTTEKLAKMSRSEQFEYVKKYFELPGNDFKPGANAGDIYAKVFLPARSGSEVLTKKGEKESYYENNTGLDIGNKNYITKTDLQSKADIARKNYNIEDVQTNPVKAGAQAQVASTKPEAELQSKASAIAKPTLEQPTVDKFRLPSKLPEPTNNGRGQNLSMLNNNTNIINGGTTYSITEETRMHYPPLIDKQYYSYG
jgi:hypothetical protein